MKKHAIYALLLGMLFAGCRSNPSSANDAGMNIGSGLDGDSIILGSNDAYPQDGDRSVFAPVYFDYDSSQVKPDEAHKVEAVSKSIRKGTYGGVIVEGHADERGSREYNLALGETRSLAVRDYLVSLGVDATQIQTRSYGEEMPDDAGHDEAAWSQNRRVVFAVY
jgi:peptidoglycan-associated lipoprotein